MESDEEPTAEEEVSLQSDEDEDEVSLQSDEDDDEDDPASVLLN
jgi:hypothetical protein